MGKGGSYKRDISLIRKVEVNYEIEFISLTWRQPEFSIAVVSEILSKNKQTKLAMKVSSSSCFVDGFFICAKAFYMGEHLWQCYHQ